MFSGAFTALITPFTQQGIDEPAFQKLVEWQIAEGIHGVVPAGTTGESPTLSHDEHKRLIDLCVEVARGKVPVMAGTGSNSTAEAVALTKYAEKAGADGALVVAPYYNKPTQEGVYQHYKALNDAVNIPIFIYNIPGRSVINITDETLARLAELPNIAGVKDATADLDRVASLRHRIGDKLTLLSGEDVTALAFNTLGGKGCISVTSNIAPKACAEMQTASLNGDHSNAMALHEKLMTLHSVLFCETNPIPVKYAAYKMGLCGPDYRLPLVPPSSANQKQIDDALRAYGGLVKSAA